MIVQIVPLTYDFQEDEFHTAKAVLLSFIVNNVPRNSFEFEMATAWEAEFLNIIQNWGNENFTYAYFSEVSHRAEVETAISLSIPIR